MDHNDLTVRPICGLEELDLFGRLAYALDHELAAGRCRPEWMWVALRGGELVPFLLDSFDLEDVTVGARLLRTAMAKILPADARPPVCHRVIPVDWRERAETRSVVEDRMAALEQTGARLLARPRKRLAFREIRDENEIPGLMTRVLAGTLDAHSLADLTRMSARATAIRHYEDELAHYRSPRGWWRVAVLPEHRGNGYLDDILAEGTRILAAQDVPRIRAATDLSNVPMANAFRRAGYVDFERTITMSWP